MSPVISVFLINQSINIRRYPLRLYILLILIPYITTITFRSPSYIFIFELNKWIFTTCNITNATALQVLLAIKLFQTFVVCVLRVPMFPTAISVEIQRIIRTFYISMTKLKFNNVI